jgi:hypothetical protein
MAKEAYYFSHDTNARTDPKIMAMLLEYKAEGFGLYWATIEMMCEHNEYKLKHNKITFNAIAMAMLCDSNRVAEFIHSCVTDYELFTTDGEYFWSESLLRRMNLKDEKRQKRVNAGKKGADSRWKNSDAIANESQSDSNAIAKDGKGKESKVKENKENKIKYAELVTMTEKEYDKLVKEHGELLTEKMIEILSNYKGANGKTYKNDYKAILSWVKDKAIKENPRLTQNKGNAINPWANVSS